MADVIEAKETRLAELELQLSSLSTKLEEITTSCRALEVRMLPLIMTVLIHLPFSTQQVVIWVSCDDTTTGKQSREAEALSQASSAQAEVSQLREDIKRLHKEYKATQNKLKLQLSDSKDALEVLQAEFEEEKTSLETQVRVKDLVELETIHLLFTATSSVLSLHKNSWKIPEKN